MLAAYIYFSIGFSKVVTDHLSPTTFHHPVNTMRCYDCIILSTEQRSVLESVSDKQVLCLLMVQSSSCVGMDAPDHACLGAQVHSLQICKRRSWPVTSGLEVRKEIMLILAPTISHKHVSGTHTWLRWRQEPSPLLAMNAERWRHRVGSACNSQQERYPSQTKWCCPWLHPLKHVQGCWSGLATSLRLLKPPILLISSFSNVRCRIVAWWLYCLPIGWLFSLCFPSRTLSRGWHGRCGNQRRAEDVRSRTAIVWHLNSWTQLYQWALLQLHGTCSSLILLFVVFD